MKNKSNVEESAYMHVGMKKERKEWRMKENEGGNKIKWRKNEEKEKEK